MDNLTPTQEEPLEIVAPRLLACMEALIAGLKAHGVTVDLTESFLLDLTQWPYQVPQALDGIPVQMSFAGSTPGWSDRVRYHLQMILLGDRRWTMCEPPKGFNLEKIVGRILTQLASKKQQQAWREQIAQDKRLAEERLATLGETLGISQETPLTLAQDNLSIEALPDAPHDVVITVKTSHANAEKIAREFRILGRRSRKTVSP